MQTEFPKSEKFPQSGMHRGCNVFNNCFYSRKILENYFVLSGRLTILIFSC